jgi:hypothetical protein
LNQQTFRDLFFESADEWICDSYSLEIRFLAIQVDGVNRLLDAALYAFRPPPVAVEGFTVTAEGLIAGQRLYVSLSKEEILQKFEAASNGLLDIDGVEFKLGANEHFDFYSELPHRDTWFSDLHLMISGSQLRSSSIGEATNIDQALRSATPPFDGIADLCTWLQLTDTRTNGRAAAINLRIGPPVDMLFDASKVSGNKLEITLVSHPKFDTSKAVLATREYPGNGIATRKQSSNKIVWAQAEGEKRLGTLKMSLTNADSVLAMLNVAGRTVRRQWFLDPEKALNTRYVATQLFDRDLKQLRLSVLDATDSVRFEQGIASLFFLMGFAAAIQIETQAPDILVMTPGGKLALIECTTKISDFQNKLGKLVERRNALRKSLEDTGHNIQADAFLVCGLPKAQIAVEQRQLTQHRVTLLCREDISEAFVRLRTPISPDEMLDQSNARLSALQSEFD